MSSLPVADWLNRLVPTIHEAGTLVMRVYGSDFRVDSKADDSPVTLADRLAEDLITHALVSLTPDIPVVGEEAASASEVIEGAPRFWLVDPLDGTKEFVQRNGQFTVNIALIDERRPVLGLVLLPALGRLYGGAVGEGSWVAVNGGPRQPIRCRTVPEVGLSVVASRSHGDEAALQSFLAGQPVADVVHAGSSLKLCLLAEGKADLYPRLGRTMEWDIAAGQAVLQAAGGSVVCLDGSPLTYGKPGFENPHFVAKGLR